MSEDETTLEITGLNKLLKALGRKDQPYARVGILGEKAAKPHYAQVEPGETGPKKISTNAEIGAAHEYGAPARGLPQRSFLRVPIADNLQKYMEKSGAFDFDAISHVLKEGTVMPWLKKVAIIAEGIVIEAFDTAGFGKWKAWKTPGYTNNANQILVDTTQLRSSITSEVKEK